MVSRSRFPATKWFAIALGAQAGIRILFAGDGAAAAGGPVAATMLLIGLGLPMVLVVDCLKLRRERIAARRAGAGPLAIRPGQ